MTINPLQGVPCVHGGQTLPNAKSHNSHIAQCPARRQQQRDAAEQHAAEQKREEQEIANSSDMGALEPSSEHDEQVLRMLTGWRVNGMPDATVQQLKTDIPQILGIVRTRLEAAFQSHHSNPAVFDSIEHIYDTAADVFAGLKTSQVERTKGKRLHNPAPTKIRKLGSTWVEKPTTYGTKQEEVHDICVDVLVEDQVERLVCTPELAQSVMEDKRSKDPDEVSDVHDGRVFREHPLFSVFPNALCFGLYGDDFECHVALGPSAGEQKVSLHYAILYNLPKPVRFNIENLLLVSVVYSKDVKKYGVDTIISGDNDNPHCSSFGGSMRRLADGIVLPGLNQLAGLPIDKVMYGAALLFYADSPFLCFYLARKESLGTSTHRMCGHCTCTNENKAECFSIYDPECPWEMITQELLEEERAELQEAEMNGTAGDVRRVSKEVGLNKTTDAFVGVPWWQSADQATNDWFHGEPEGPTKDHTCLIVHHGLTIGAFTLPQFTRLLFQFPWPSEQGAWHPRRVFRKQFFGRRPHKKLGKTLKLTGRGALAVGLALPAILHGLFAADDEHWICFQEHMCCVAWGRQESHDRKELPAFEDKQQSWRRKYYELYHRLNPLIHQGCHLVEKIEELGPPCQRQAFRCGAVPWLCVSMSHLCWIAGRKPSIKYSRGWAKQHIGLKCSRNSVTNTT